ncbi:MAG: lipocalin family protein [Bacteroidales bacterium]|nr:lipocalin family protein [Bacteroidales bacterium]MBN2698628.1 lipocalin family protein [Bacteroidales bacterium]
MKILFVLFSLLLINFLSEAQDKNLTGTWNIIECAYTTADGTEPIMVDEIAAGTAISDYAFMEDGTYKLVTNMSGSGTTDTYDGTWNTSGNKLIMTLTVNGQSMEIEWVYEFKEDILVLSRTSPDGNMSVANSFRKK